MSLWRRSLGFINQSQHNLIVRDESRTRHCNTALNCVSRHVNTQKHIFTYIFYNIDVLLIGTSHVHGCTCTRIHLYKSTTWYDLSNFLVYEDVGMVSRCSETRSVYHNVHWAGFHFSTSEGEKLIMWFKKTGIIITIAY